MSDPHLTNITKLELHNFRNHNYFLIDKLSSSVNVLTGINGAGKTSVLEAISLLSFSKGLRGAKIADLMNRNAQASSWKITSNIESIYGLREVATFLNAKQRAKTETRSIQIDGKIVKRKDDLSELLRNVWLTLPMQQIFSNSSSERRTFFDLMVSNFFANHAGNLSGYEKSMRERLKLIKNQCKDEHWLNSLENSMFEFAQKISLARTETLKLLTNAIDQASSPFHRAQLSLYGEPIAEDFLDLQKKNRKIDYLTGRTNLGPHLYDLEVTFKERGTPAKLCSTGEQKALLLNIVLAHVRAIISNFNVMPVLLFDEVISHLDTENRNLLFEEIINLKAQSFLTGVDKKSFQYINATANFIEL